MIFSSVKRILLLQCILTSLAVVFFLFKGGINGALSACLGGLCVVIPSWMYAVIACRKRHVPLKNLVLAHFVAEAVKFIATIILIAVVFVVFRNVSVVALGAGFILALLAYWFGLFIKD